LLPLSSWYQGRNYISLGQFCSLPSCISDAGRGVMCVLTCPGTAGGRSLGRLAEWGLYGAKAAAEVPQTRCYCYLAEDRQNFTHQALTLGIKTDQKQTNSLKEMYNVISPAGRYLSESWCFWWRSLQLPSGDWFSACTWDKAASKGQNAGGRKINGFLEERWNLLEKIVLCFSVKLIDAQLQHLQTSRSLSTKKHTCEYIYVQKAFIQRLLDANEMWLNFNITTHAKLLKCKMTD